VVKQVSEAFDLYWNDELSYPATALRGKPPTAFEIESGREKLKSYTDLQKNSPYLKALRESDLSVAIREEKVQYDWGKAEVIYDLPEKLEHSFSKKELHIAPKVKEHMDSTKNELIVFTPYFVPRKTEQKGTPYRPQG
jgi:putative cardiolipin synthase